MSDAWPPIPKYITITEQVVAKSIMSGAGSGKESPLYFNSELFEGSDEWLTGDSSNVIIMGAHNSTSAINGIALTSGAITPQNFLQTSSSSASFSRPPIHRSNNKQPREEDVFHNCLMGTTILKTLQMEGKSKSPSELRRF